ncbi:hypothetical protein ACIO52_21675 [Nocardia sp. NPDC087230]|uniref:hypothetical protein n=1 Tax=Nocardia sp. NPDC087230 TaxID=3364331 RepID=UPI0037F19EB7
MSDLYISEEELMCYPVTCSTCKKTTWGGCGSHVASVMNSVPASRRCTCETHADRAGNRGIFGRILGR